ncbi:FAD dependent oxidoreductase [Chaetomium sp. MPI-CAGE-AT-0009]|nr:FAD dependent oxidoreductase [Chaetomium sp. MPI-CAGE-AT-0009]
MDSVIIIGTGVFGLSAADHIHRKWPTAQLSIVSRPSPLAPSDDISKIVRVDYNNVERMTEAVEAQKQWKSDTFSRYQRSIGRVVIYEQDDVATAQKVNEAREKLGLQSREPCGSRLMQDTFGTTTAPETLTYVLASDDSIVDWESCISDARERAKNACTNSGGTFYESGVARLVNDGTRITALILENGEEIKVGSAQIVLAVGPWFAQVLAASDITLPPDGRTPVATGLFSYGVRLSKEQAEFFRDKPIISHGGKADFLPPANGDVGKIAWAESFTNLRGSTLSRVEDLSQSALAEYHMHKTIGWAREFLPALQGARITSVTSYWDGVTATQDPLIDKHPQFPNLTCVVGGSYNRAKDLPTIGSTVVDVLSGRHVPDRYSWEPKREYSHRDQSYFVARGDFAAMETEAQEKLVSISQDSSLGII